MSSWIDSLMDSDAGSDAGNRPRYHTQDDVEGQGSTTTSTDLHAMRNLNNLEGKIRWLESIFKNWPSSRSEAFRVEIMNTYYNMLFSTLGLGERQSAAPTSTFSLRGSELDPALRERMTNSTAEFLMHALTGNTLPSAPARPVAPGFMSQAFTPIQVPMPHVPFVPTSPPVDMPSNNNDGWT